MIRDLSAVTQNPWDTVGHGTSRPQEHPEQLLSLSSPAAPGLPVPFPWGSRRCPKQTAAAGPRVAEGAEPGGTRPLPGHSARPGFGHPGTLRSLPRPRRPALPPPQPLQGVPCRHPDATTEPLAPATARTAAGPRPAPLPLRPTPNFPRGRRPPALTRRRSCRCRGRRVSALGPLCAGRRCRAGRRRAAVPALRPHRPPVRPSRHGAERRGAGGPALPPERIKWPQRGSPRGAQPDPRRWHGAALPKIPGVGQPSLVPPSLPLQPGEGTWPENPQPPSPSVEGHASRWSLPRCGPPRGKELLL